MHIREIAWMCSGVSTRINPGKPVIDKKYCGFL
jgi:hypothetical protein